MHGKSGGMLLRKHFNFLKVKLLYIIWNAPNFNSFDPLVLFDLIMATQTSNFCLLFL